MTETPPKDLDWRDFNNATNAADTPPKRQKKIDADEIKARLLGNLESTLHSLFPFGKIEGKHFVIGDVLGTDGDSLKITLKGKYKGCWKDFENGQGGDIFALFAGVFSLDPQKDFKKLLERISEWLGDPVQFYREAVYKDTSAGSTAQRGAPVDTLGMWADKFDYFDINGNLIACVYKYLTEKGKTFRCWNVIDRKWTAPDPRPLFNLPGIKNADLVFLVEGEKCANALIERGYCATTLIGGSKNPIEKTDLTPLLGKIVCVWPDNDTGGKEYAEAIIQKLHEIGVETIKLLIPPESASAKWDVADAYEEGFDVPTYIETAIDGIGYSFEPPKIRVRSIGEMMDDTTPMPPDVVGPRILGPGDIGVLAGAPKVGKSAIILSAAMHWAAGLPFIGMTVDKPLKIVYMQAEIGYFFLRERIREFYPELANNPLVRENLVVSDKFHHCLNDEGKDEFVKRGLTAFKSALPDMMIIDPLRNVFYSERENATENDNTAMIEFLRDGVIDVQQRINPDMAMWLLHHLNKINTKALEEALFNAISGGGSLRGYYTAGVVAYQPDINMPEIKLCFELRNGPPIPPKLIIKKGHQWVELSPEERHLIEKKQERKNKVAHDKRREKIIEILHKEALDNGKLYVRSSFASTFSRKYGLGSQATINRAVGEMLNDSTVKITDQGQIYGQDATNSKHGYMVVEDMFIKVDGKRTRVLPTHFLTDNNSITKEVENPHAWVYRDREEKS